MARPTLGRHLHLEQSFQAQAENERSPHIHSWKSSSVMLVPVQRRATSPSSRLFPSPLLPYIGFGGVWGCKCRNDGKGSAHLPKTIRWGLLHTHSATAIDVQSPSHQDLEPLA